MSATDAAPGLVIYTEETPRYRDHEQPHARATRPPAHFTLEIRDGAVWYVPAEAP